MCEQDLVTHVHVSIVTNDSLMNSMINYNNKQCAAFRIISEKQHAVRLGGGRAFLIQWKDDPNGTAQPCAWEVEENLTHCEQLMREWLKLSMSEKADKLKEAQKIVGIATIGGGINAVTLTKHRLSDNEWLACG